eukprot:m51a1_g12251 putative nod3 protein (713) ;mRNA; r:154245-157031
MDKRVDKAGWRDRLRDCMRSSGPELDLGHVFDVGVSSSDPRGLQELAAALRSNTAVTSLNLSWNAIGDPGTAIVADILRENTTLTSLNLSYNGIGDKGARVLAEALGTSTTLKTLSLAGNAIGDEGARQVAQALAEGAAVADLNLSMNGISYDGARALVEALQGRTSVTALDLSGNAIGAKILGDLSQALQANTTMTYLNLSSIGSVGDGPVVDFTKVIHTNISLTSVELSRNEVGEEALKALQSVLSRNKLFGPTPVKAAPGSYRKSLEALIGPPGAPPEPSPTARVAAARQRVEDAYARVHTSERELVRLKDSAAQLSAKSTASRALATAKRAEAAKLREMLAETDRAEAEAGARAEDERVAAAQAQAQAIALKQTVKGLREELQRCRAEHAAATARLQQFCAALDQRDPEALSTRDVVDLLREASAPAAAQVAFARSKVGGKQLLSMSDRALAALDVVAPVERRRLRNMAAAANACGSLALRLSVAVLEQSASHTCAFQEAALVPTWGPEQVCKWLSRAQMPPDVCAAAQRVGISGDALLQLSEEEVALIARKLSDRACVSGAVSLLRGQAFRAISSFVETKRERLRGVPLEYVCPLTLSVMREPVLAPDGFVYERLALSKWLSERFTSPMSGRELDCEPESLVRLPTLQADIEAFMLKQRASVCGQSPLSSLSVSPAASPGSEKLSAGLPSPMLQPGSPADSTVSAPL